jgi:hypothetical protein
MLRLAAAAVSTAGDAVARNEAIEGADHGLRGGSVTPSKGGSLLTLKRDQLIAGVAVSGTVAVKPSVIPDDGSEVSATLSVSAPGLRGATFTATWTTQGSDAIAQVAGSVAHQGVMGTMPAP